MTVKLKRECNCTKKLEIPLAFHCKTKSDAILKANEVIALLKAKSCHTHDFNLIEKEEFIEIDSKLNTDNFL
ncbi:MAG: hypothetical protein ACNI3C_07085 [Candidatus Marinarcus sp.]|uniref:hypothetical protein n=1 Tax=Candidatus Marinarcus sp. TaxID=3100987 RepID=UPI003B00C6EA